MIFYWSKRIYVHTAAQWQRRDKELGVQTKRGCAEHHRVLQWCVKKAAMLKELFSSVF